MTTEIYIGSYSLDLHKDETISMKYTSKDLQDISKVFSPFSQDFTFPYTAKNARAFGFFGNTDVIKSNLENKFPCKIYTNGLLNLTGFLILKDLKYKDGKPTDFSGSFGTTMTNLKDRIGDLTLNDLTNTPLNVDLAPNNVFNLCKDAGNQTIDGVSCDYYVPLMSNLRVWGYGTAKDNVAASSSTDWIESIELRPALSMRSIINLIIKKFNLTVIMPLESKREYLDAFVWCNKERIVTTSTAVRKRLKFDKQFTYAFIPVTALPKPWTLNTSDSSIVSTALPVGSTGYKATFGITFLSPSTVDGSALNSNLTFYFVNKATGLVIHEQTELLEAGGFTGFQFPAMLSFVGDFYIELKSTQPIVWQSMRISTTSFDVLWSGINYPIVSGSSSNNANSEDFGGSYVDLIQALPATKIIDFLQSFFKTFNISVYDTSPNNENLYWLTPDDILTTGNAYSKLAPDYTRYLSNGTYTKSASTDYNYYNFKHATSKYKSNIDYKREKFIEYGQTLYPLVPPSNPKEFKVETAFSIIPPVTITGTPIVTAYGFTDAEPTYLGTGEARYTPNYDELTIFYREISYTSISATPLRFKKTNGTGIYVAGTLDRYIKTLPVNGLNQSLSFSIIVFNSIEYQDTLFSRYYDEQIIRLINPNVLNHEFTLNLPSTELYLNESVTGATPTGFRLQNDVIIGENRFSIVEAVIDITTGKTKINLLNY